MKAKQAKPSRFVRMFQPQFAGLVERGEKCQTVRAVPKRMPRPGDRISLRAWSGRPYRSKHRVLCEATIINVHPVRIAGDELTVAGHWMGPEKRERFARADGFAGWEDLRCWFEQTHGLPFAGIVIYWLEEK